MNKLILEQRYWIIGIFFSYIISQIILIYLFKITINFEFIFSIIVGFNSVIYLILFRLIYKNKKIKNKNILLTGLILLAIYVIYRSYLIINLNYLNQTFKINEMIMLNIGLVLVFLILIGFKRILR